MRITHISFERLGPRPLRAEAAPLPVVMSAMVRVTHVVLRLCALIPQVGQNWGTRSDGTAQHRPHGELHDSLLPPGLRVAQTRDQNLSSVLKGAFCLLRSGDTEMSSS
jgi:hypothetical protein